MTMCVRCFNLNQTEAPPTTCVCCCCVVVFRENGHPNMLLVQMLFCVSFLFGTHACVLLHFVEHIVLFLILNN